MAKAHKFPTNQEYNGVKSITASTTLTREDANKIVSINTTTATIVTLPPVKPSNKGARFHVQVRQLPGAGGHEIAPNANDSIFASFAASTAAADDKSLFFGTDAAGAGDKVGDFIVLVSDGVDGYHQVAGQGSFFREA